MNDKGVELIVIFDSCHSGGATRGQGQAESRSATPGPGVGDVIDTTVRPLDELAPTLADATAAWDDVQAARTRSVQATSAWEMAGGDYTFLAACRASESAYEYPFENGEYSGALTYWLMDTLQVASPTLTYSQVRDRIQSKVHAQFHRQTPDLQGKGERLVFGFGSAQVVSSILVTKVEGDKVQVGAGQAAGLRKGAELAVYPLHTTDFSQVDKRVALLQVTELGAVDAWTTIQKQLNPGASIEAGAPALLLDPANLKLKRTVYLHALPDDLHAALTAAINLNGGGFVRLAQPGEDADYQVTVTAAGDFEIWDSAGIPIPNLRPALLAALAANRDLLVQRLVHLSRYASVRLLDNRDANSPLVDALTVELLGVQDDFDPADDPAPQPFSLPNTLVEGQTTFLRIRNNLQAGTVNDPSRILNICVLNLQPEWGIEQIYPAGSAHFHPLDPGEKVDLPLRTSVPSGAEEGVDVLKVFATRDAPTFGWLTLAPLDQPPVSKGTRGAGMTPLEQFFAAVAEDGIPDPTRSVTVYSNPSTGWTVEQVEIRTKKA